MEEEGKELERMVSLGPNTFKGAMEKLVQQKAISKSYPNTFKDIQSIEVEPKSTTVFDTSNSSMDLSELRTSVLKNFERVNRRLNSKLGKRATHRKKKKRANILAQNGK